ncbi:hypothetical protein LguiB_021804 [Lonicera macranthoides]
MLTARSSHSLVDDTGAIDTIPFLTSSASNINFPCWSRRIRRTLSLRGAARFLRRASSRRMLQEPSMRVCDSAVEEIEERQRDDFYGIQAASMSAALAQIDAPAPAPASDASVALPALGSLVGASLLSIVALYLH